MYSVYSGSYDINYYNALAQLPSRIKAYFRLIKTRKSLKKAVNTSGYKIVY